MIFSKHDAFAFITATVAAFIVAGCGYLTAGSKKAISVQTTPTGANISTHPITGRFTTPVTLMLSRKHSYTIVAQKEGYHDANFMIRKEIRPVILAADLLLSFPALFIPLIVDATTGAWNDLLPDQASITLHKIDDAFEGPDLIEITFSLDEGPAAEAVTIGSSEPVMIEVVQR